MPNVLIVTFSVIIPAIVGALYYYFHTRSRRIAETLRQSLSDDIHDEVGSLLTKTAMRVELLRNRTDGQFPELFEIEKNLRESVHAMRNLIWSFDQGQNATNDFVSRIRTTVDFMFADTDYTCIVTDRSSRLKFDRSFEVKRNILFIVKELANNTLKYANGTCFEVVIRYRNGKWRLSIADNGKTIDQASQVVMKGKGLKSIVRRMKLIDGQVSFKRDDDGFFTELIF
jgi:signal transduction histidine kinase